jgi:hypothetical protein
MATNYDLTNTGPEVQGRLDQVPVTQQELEGEVQDRIDGDENLQNQINAIINDKAVVSLAATPSPIFVGEEKIITLNATTDTEATSIKIKKGDTEIASGSGFSLSGFDAITPSEAGDTTYTAEFTIAELQKVTRKNVVAVYPVYYGAGQVYGAAQEKASARISPAGTYNVTVLHEGDSVFFIIPATMSINKATMSGFEFPLQAPVNVTVDGVAYKSYQSGNTYNVGTLTIVIS